jgi:hypothetical protein
VAGSVGSPFDRWLTAPVACFLNRSASRRFHMEYETPEIIASYSDDELVSEAAVAMTYGNDLPV